MWILIQSKEDIAADNKDGDEKGVVYPDILEGKNKLKKPEKEQGMRWIGEREIVTSILVDICHYVGILTMVNRLYRP